MKPNRNPFRYGADFARNDLVGRKDEAAHVRNTIRNGGRLFLIGARGFGKTSILRAAQANLSPKDAIVLYVNAETSPDIGTLIGEIITGAVAQLNKGTDDGNLKTSRFFSHLYPISRFGTDGKQLTVSVDIDHSTNKCRQMELLANTLDSLNRLAGTMLQDQPVALMIDEFSTLMARFGITAEAQIRSVVQCHQNVGYIFSGSNVRLMMDMTTKYSRPFYHSGDNLYLRPIPVAEFATWMHEQFQEGGFEVSGEEPILRIISLAEEVPRNIQMLAHYCWDYLNSQNGTNLTVQFVESAFQRMCISLDSSFRQAWDQLTPLQKRTLTAVLHDNGERRAPGKIARSIKSPVSSVCSALRALHDRNILWSDWTIGGVRVRLQDPFFAYWIRVAVPRINTNEAAG